jgi:hypothetical protein
MITKLAAALEMSFKVPDSEKEIANHAVKNFSYVINSISIIKNYLDKLYDPFKTADSIPKDDLIKFRGRLNLIKLQVKKHFTTLQKISIKSLKSLNYFSTDTHCIELINTFKESISDVFSAKAKLINTLDDYSISEFKDKLIAAIDNLRKEINQTEELCRDRIIKHLSENIAGDSWISDNNYKENLEEKIPTVIEIYKKINESEGGQLPQIKKRPQSLNFSDSQKVSYPQDLRNATRIAT